MVAANGQDGFLSTVLALEQGSKVLALTRSRDARLSFLESRNPKLIYKWSEDYIFKLTEHISSFRPTYVFYFASQHGPSGTMPANSHSLELTELLTRTVPDQLISSAKKENFGITLPLSSRLYSGYLEGAKGTVSVDLDTPPKPNDFYGYGKLELLQMSNRARSEGVYVNSPILFNHGSIFSKTGYVSHAIANAIASRMSSNYPHPRISEPSAQVDLSDAVRVVDYLLSMKDGSNGPVLVSSGVTPTISYLIHEQSKVVSRWLDKPVASVREVTASSPTLTAPTSLLSISKIEAPDSYNWLGGMAVAKLFSVVGGVDDSLPQAVRDTLPFTFRGIAPELLSDLTPKEYET